MNAITYYQGRKYTRNSHVRRDEITRTVRTGNHWDLSIRSHGRRYGRSYGMDDDILVKRAKQCLTRPDSFAYYGDIPMFESWGYSGIGQSRDSEALELSNYRRIFADMQEMFPDEDMGENYLSWVTDFRASHWAVGWVESIVVKVLYDPDEDITPQNITSAFRHIAGIAEFLHREYPIYDEADLSELEYEEASDYFDQEWSSMLRGWDEDYDGPEPSEDEKWHIWSEYDLVSRDNAAWDDKLAEYVREQRQERISAAKAAVRRILKG